MIYQLIRKKKKKFFLEELESAELPPHIYGGETQQALEWLEVFSKLDSNMGILLSGLKGSGKSLMADLICHHSNLPVYLVLKKSKGLQEFLGKITEPCVVLFQEFDKTYRTFEEQDSLLSILDGSFNTRMLFVLTTNTSKVNPLLINRIKRIRYHKEYAGLSEETMGEVIDRELEEKKHQSELKMALDLLSVVSMDMLQGIISEINFTGKSPKECLKTLNIQLEHSHFSARLWLKGVGWKYSTINYNPILAGVVRVSYPFEGRWGTYEKWYEKSLDEMDIEVEGKEISFTDKEGNKVVIAPQNLREKFKLW